jgi:tetratricopeptide (TPR) repeat protein
VQSEQNEAQAALGSGEQARELYRQLLVATPNHPTYQRRMAETCNELGLFHLAAGRLDEAEQMFDRAITLNEKLIKQQPHDLDLLVSAGGACCNLGNVFNDREVAQEALKWYARADERLSVVLSGQPEHPVARQYMANTLIFRMSVLHELQRYDDELRDCQRAIQLTAGDQQEALTVKEADLQALLSHHEAP